MEFKNLLVKDGIAQKECSSSDYNFKFNKINGYFARWGKTEEDDPKYAPSPEILDIEVTTKCNGIDGKVCPFCYKSNTPNGENMSFETFKTILDKFPPILTQIAFGADSHATSNPDLFKMMEYARKKRIIPNITVAQISEDTASKLASLCGAVAVSRYENKNVCYDAVKSLTDKGMTQINIHQMISKETYSQAMETLKDTLTDERLRKLNAVVFLSLKQKGRGTKYNQLSTKEFKDLVDFALSNQIRIGFDSCSAYKFLQAVKDNENFEFFEKISEPCESSLFSSYIDVKGRFFPCSFSEEIEGWEDGIDVVNCNNFVKDVWNNSKTISFREKLLKTSDGNSIKCRECPLYKI